MWVISLLAAIGSIIARALGFSKYRAGREQGQTEVRLGQEHAANEALKAQAQAASDAAPVLGDAHELADRVRKDGF